ncbi:unnamed protein product [Protopolystoma xenopodis]|uniref:Uncharacterized protein n=1 Tax=Protopolystoma xenopodis TaxID=117903 RepID=A0A3S5ANL2_9PLAT|nr:unnamed protein product [Protopolystoma xenopodis]
MPGAGTLSTVCFILSGDRDETTARALTDPFRNVLQRGNRDRFLLACKRLVKCSGGIEVNFDERVKLIQKLKNAIG